MNKNDNEFSCPYIFREWFSYTHLTCFQLLYWYHCPRYLYLRNKVYEEPEVKLRIQPYQTLFTELSRRTGTNITHPEDVFYLDNLFQALVSKFSTNLELIGTYNKFVAPGI